MKTYAIFVIGGISVIIGIMLYPTLHGIVSSVDTTGWLPLTAMAKTMLSYAFLGFIVYGLFKISRR